MQLHRSLIRTALVLAGALGSAPLLAQDILQQTAWLAWFNSARLNEQWGLLSDVQLRSRDDHRGVQNTLLRAGFSRFQENGNQWTLGYAWIGTDPAQGRSRVEHRYWQQFMRSHPMGSASLTHRLRLEQRNVEQPAGNRLFSQRARYFARAVIPLPRWTSGTGPFLALQNEVFVNVSHRENVNGRRFDQNRAYVAGGYRLRAGFDLELGYLNQHSAGRLVDTENHVIQLALYSRF